MPRYRVTWDGYLSGSSQPMEVGGRYLDEDSFWEELFEAGDPLRKFYLDVQVDEIKKRAQARE
jgi:hypothetical protein